MDVKAWPAVGTRIKRARQSQRLSQTELSERAGINLSSVFRVEKGKPVRAATLGKIAKGLDVVLDTLLSGDPAPPEGPNLIVHRAAIASWFAEQDRRAKLPADHVERYQDANERRRIGRVGFVSWFMSPPTTIMKNGPGVVPLEIHGLGHGPFNMHFYEDAVIYAVRGRVSVQAGSDVVNLDEGDWVGFKSANLLSIGPVGPLEAQTEPPLVLWIGANRIGRRKKKKTEP